MGNPPALPEDSKSSTVPGLAGFSPSLPRSGGEGWGEEALFPLILRMACEYFVRSPSLRLSPLETRGARESDAPGKFIAPPQVARQGRAASSRSTFLKPPALPEVLTVSR